jgi:hypothetical protein
MNEVIELIGDLWTAPIDFPYPVSGVTKVVLIPTNGIVKPNGHLVMGAGVAKQAAAKYFSLSWLLGLKVQAHGNNAFSVSLQAEDVYDFLFSWPTKYHYSYQSDLDLIVAQAKRIMAMFDVLEAPDEVEEGMSAWPKTTVIGYAPLVGCGLGGLKWDEVKEALAPIVKDRIFFVHRAR